MCGAGWMAASASVEIRMRAGRAGASAAHQRRAAPARRPRCGARTTGRLRAARARARAAGWRAGRAGVRLGRGEGARRAGIAAGLLLGGFFRGLLLLPRGLLCGLLLLPVGFFFELLPLFGVFRGLPRRSFFGRGCGPGRRAAGFRLVGVASNGGPCGRPAFVRRRIRRAIGRRVSAPPEPRWAGNIEGRQSEQNNDAQSQCLAESHWMFFHSTQDGGDVERRAAPPIVTRHPCVHGDAKRVARRIRQPRGTPRDGRAAFSASRSTG